MSLFQKIIVKKYLNNLPSDVIDENYKKYTKYFNDLGRAQRIKALNEEQYQEGFLRELFVDCLGYIINPDENFNLTTEFKNKTDAEKADGAILKDGKPIAVIELKSTKTIDLKTIEKQAFNYKAHQSNCMYVITSNFEKIRLYINDATEFEEFNVFELSENEFKFLHLCLSKVSLFEDIPAEMKEKSNQHEELISKKLYNDYSIFRNSIFQNLTKNNPHIDKLLLFKKAQKLLDRFLFIFFAEDKGLIPPNIISKIIDDYNKLKDLDVYTPLYTIFKKYFSYINKGYEKLSIDAYNGGLFQFDEILDNVEIDDEILITDSLKLSNYDFDSEIDVNILGHIFEHSLTDIEKLNAEISGENLDKKQTRRKKEGVFYTPNYITKYIVENTVGTLCAEKRNELHLSNIEVDETYFKKGRKAAAIPSPKGEQLFDKLEKYKEWLLSLKILDPACGSGAFLNQALNFLIDEHNFIIDLETDLRKGQSYAFDIDTAVLENNLYGVDINEESVEIAKLSLWLKTAKKGRKLTDLSKHIKCGNSLIDDPEIAGDKAFDWNKEFPGIMQNGGFDVVIGNPPYVFARENISENEKEYYIKNFNSALYQLNTYLLFIEKSIELLKENGIYGLIVPNAWLMVFSGKGLREFILNNCKLNQIINLEGYSFESVNVETIIILAQKKKIKINNFDILLSKDKEFIFSHKRNQFDFSQNDSSEFKVFSDDTSLLLTKRLKINSVILDSIVQIKAGLQAYEKGKGSPKQTAEDVKNRPFDYNYKFDDKTYKYLEGKDVSRYFVSWSDLFLKYGDHLAAPRTFNLFNGKKIIIREISGKYPRSIIATYNEDIYLYNRSNIAIIEKEEKNISLKYVLVILNSSLMSYYFMKNTAKSVRKMFPKVILKDLRLFPFKEIKTDAQQPFIEKADLMLSLNKQKQEKINKFLHRLETIFEIEKFSNKMKAFYDYDFKTLNAEFKKNKIKLTLSQQDEWEEYFNNYKNEILKLQMQIDKTDKEIDQMVYELYGLTDEEIEVVENAGE
jgi:type I restriction-modification system DNA methylase subunit